jgi:hypothetical protein
LIFFSPNAQKFLGGFDDKNTFSNIYKFAKWLIRAFLRSFFWLAFADQG